MSEIANTWQKTKLGNHIDLINGFAFPSANFTDGNGLPLIRIRDLNKQTTEVGYDGAYSETYVVERGDLLIGMDGDFHTVKWRGEQALLNQRVCKLVTKDEQQLNQDFLFYRIITEIQRINHLTAATTVKHLASKDILGIELELPSPEEQTQIAEILSTLDQNTFCPVM